MVDCIFCKIVHKQIPTEFVYEDDHVVVFNDIRPKATVHLLIVSKEHIASLNAISKAHEALMGHMVMLLPQLAKKQSLTGFRTVINTGKDGGQEVDHLHLHLLGGGLLPRMFG